MTYSACQITSGETRSRADALASGSAGAGSAERLRTMSGSRVRPEKHGRVLQSRSPRHRIQKVSRERPVGASVADQRFAKRFGRPLACMTAASIVSVLAFTLAPSARASSTGAPATSPSSLSSTSTPGTIGSPTNGVADLHLRQRSHRWSARTVNAAFRSTDWEQTIRLEVLFRFRRMPARR